MHLPDLLDELGYSASSAFLRRGTAAFERAPDFGHIFRTAAERKGCRLEGVYTLRPLDGAGPLVPVVYVCDADDIATADRIHRLVWNQDVVPFLLVRTAAGIRLYSGFQCAESRDGAREGLLEPLIEFDQISTRLAEFHADAIDSGEIWRRRGDDVRPDKRVYWTLLENLKLLAKKFAEEFGRARTREVIHPLIGKYVYLYYLKDRDFLSERRLGEWEIQHDTVYGRGATLSGLRSICQKLDGFLNGHVFPLKFRGPHAPTEEQIQRIAGAFAGDTFQGGWQFHLPFTAFKFDHIPIETLSMIYEQFLHLPEKKKPENADGNEDDEEEEAAEPSAGRKAGAYYTPIPVVNYMLSEMDRRRRLQRGVRVFDPSCGSGAFLVQCYRRLIEREFPTRRKKPTPAALATLLKRHIFGVDRDADACSVAEFSLYLTLLEYVEPADLVDHPRFRLPTLRGKNIFQSDFFKVKPFKTKFHWVVGNPPWTKPKGRNALGELREVDSEAMIQWMEDHAKTMPVGGNAVAQAFTWRCREFLSRDGECGLLIPAMTLFEDPSQYFRRAFFAEHRLHAVANFSNLAEVLFAGRSRVPAAAIFFGLRKRKTEPDALEMTTVFSPMVANQESTRPASPGARMESWSLAINGDEVRELPYGDIASGSGLPWKLATWGSHLDKAFLARLDKRYECLCYFEAPWIRTKQHFDFSSSAEKIFGISEGLQTRPQDGKGVRRRNKEALSEPLEYAPEIRGARRLIMRKFERLRRIFSFTAEMTEAIPDSETWVRKGRKSLPLAVCKGPHIVVGENRTFAAFTDSMLVFPGRQIGICARGANIRLLKALALFLSSDFAFYHEFFKSPTFGVKRPISTLRTLLDIPCPIPRLSEADLKTWSDLYDELAKTQAHSVPKRAPTSDFLGFSSPLQRKLFEKANALVSESLDLDDGDRALIHDLIHVRLGLDDGDQDPIATKPATNTDLFFYAEWFQRELSSSTGEEAPYSITILHDGHSGFLAAEPAKAEPTVRVLPADAQEASVLARTREQLREEQAQWVYFDRALRIHRGEKTYLFKPLQRMHWTRSRALLDAADVVVGMIHQESQPQ